MKKLGELSLQEYNKLKQSGMFWEIYPESTGNIDDDLECLMYVSEDGTHIFYDIRDEEAVYEI
jgi:hypothetical protein